MFIHTPKPLSYLKVNFRHNYSLLMHETSVRYDNQEAPQNIFEEEVTEMEVYTICRSIITMWKKMIKILETQENEETPKSK